MHSIQYDLSTSHPPSAHASAAELHAQARSLKERICRRIALALIAWGRGTESDRFDRRELAIHRHAAATEQRTRELEAQRSALLSRPSL